MARKEDVFAVANFFEINTLCHWRKCPCVTKTQRYGYIWYIGSCAEPSHRSTVGCEKSANVLKGKWHKNIRKCKMAKNHFSRSDFGSWGGFLGAILYWKVVLKFWFGHHFSIQTSPQNPQKATSGTKIGPQKVIFGHFAFFWYFGAIFQATRAIFFKCKAPQLNHFFEGCKHFPGHLYV